MDVVEWVPNFTRRLGEVPLIGEGTCKIKDSNAQIRICVRRVKQVMLKCSSYEQERDTHKLVVVC